MALQIERKFFVLSNARQKQVVRSVRLRDSLISSSVPGKRPRTRCHARLGALLICQVPVRAEHGGGRHNGQKSRRDRRLTFATASKARCPELSVAPSRFLSQARHQPGGVFTGALRRR